jgi:hypothetical protein
MKPTIVTDGIVNEPIYRKEQKKLLWILKEANAKEGDDVWDMSLFLRERSVEQGGLFSYSKWKNTFGLLCKISWGVLEPSLSFEEVENFDDEKLSSVLDRIAYINLKKEAGGARVDYNNFENKIDVSFINSQIETIKPNLIICGGTFHFIKKDIPNFDYNKEWFYRDENGIRWINGYHTNQTIISHKQYFETVRSKLQ